MYLVLGGALQLLGVLALLATAPSCTRLIDFGKCTRALFQLAELGCCLLWRASLASSVVCHFDVDQALACADHGRRVDEIAERMWYAVGQYGEVEQTDVRIVASPSRVEVSPQPRADGVVPSSDSRYG